MRPQSPEAADLTQAQALFRDQKMAFLATMDPEGFPFGSIVPYLIGPEGWPVVLISSLAEHTQNLIKEPKVSLTITLPNFERKSQRLTLVSRASRRIGELDSLRNHYQNRFPQSEIYINLPDFTFFDLIPLRIRYIGGFGRAFWLTPSELGITVS